MEQQDCALEWRDFDLVTPGAQTKFPTKGLPFRIELEFKYEVPGHGSDATHRPLHSAQYGSRVSEEERVLLSFGGREKGLTVVVGDRYAAPQLLLHSVINSANIAP